MVEERAAGDREHREVEPGRLGLKTSGHTGAAAVDRAYLMLQTFMGFNKIYMRFCAEADDCLCYKRSQVCAQKKNEVTRMVQRRRVKQH